jgi:hypothetical protein
VKFSLGLLSISTCCLLSSCLLLVGCRIPRIPVKQTVDYAGEFNIGGQRVQHFRARDYMTLDTSQPIVKLEYLPIDIFAALDDRDSVRFYLISTWQEYIWRFSERLAPVDRQYYAPSPLYLQHGGDTAVITWGYPNIADRDRDLRDVVKRRNDYWSIDYVTPGKAPDERWVGVLQSFPQFSKYTPFNRFTPGGPYQRAMEDSAEVFRVLRSELFKALGKNESDSTRP